MTLDQMYATPGFYRVSWASFRSVCEVNVEIDENNVCHQLKPYSTTRDGVLSREGWHHGVMVKKIKEPRCTKN